MTEPIDNPKYWKERLSKAKETGQLHHSIFRCPLERWQQIEARHRRILAEKVKDSDSILDCGCGYGRLLTLMPVAWHGLYFGVDVSPDFVALARERHPCKLFFVGDLKAIDMVAKCDLAVLISIRPMVIRNEGQAAWDAMEREVKRLSWRQLYLEYDPDDLGSER